MRASTIFGFLLAIALGIFAVNDVYAQDGTPPINPGKGTFCPNFIDEDGDGINDNMQRMHQGKAWQNGEPRHGQGMHGQNGTGNRGQGFGMGNQGEGRGMGSGTCPNDGSGIGQGNGPGAGMGQGNGMGPGNGTQGNGPRHGGRR